MCIALKSVKFNKNTIMYIKYENKIEANKFCTGQI